jgi:hypothetical protein
LEQIWGLVQEWQENYDAWKVVVFGELKTDDMGFQAQGMLKRLNKVAREVKVRGGSRTGRGGRENRRRENREGVGEDKGEKRRGDRGSGIRGGREKKEENGRGCGMIRGGREERGAGVGLEVKERRGEVKGRRGEGEWDSR